VKPSHNKYPKVAVALLVCAVALALPVLLGDSYYLHLLILAGMNALLAMTFVMLLRTGLVSLAIAAFMGIGATTTAALTVKLGLSFWAALPVSVVATAFVAFIVGYPLLKNAGFTFVLLTAVLGMLIPQIFGSVDYLGGFSGLQGVPSPEPISIGGLTLTFGSKTSYYYLLLVLFAIVTFAFWRLYKARTGRAWMTIGLNPPLADSIGVDVFRYRLLAFVIASAAAGLVGCFYASYIGSVVPTQFTVFKTIYIHIYAIMGGIPFALLGPIVGAAFLTGVPELLRGLPYIEPIIMGVLFILLILFLPDGLLSLVRRQEGEGLLLTVYRHVVDAAKRLPVISREKRV
jgi:branched-chain amino acid transport system permease protein